MLRKKKVHHFPETWLSGVLATSVLNKGKSAIPSLFNGPVVLSSASDKANFFAKIFLRTLILMALVSLYVLSVLELI